LDRVGITFSNPTAKRCSAGRPHAHANETFQVNLGLYGALLVVDSGRYDPEHERLILVGGNISGGRTPRINGKNVPDTLS
jgi:hypothetical protein